MVTHYDMLTGEVIEQTPVTPPTSVDAHAPACTLRLMTLDEAVAIEKRAAATKQRATLATELLGKRF